MKIFSKITTIPLIAVPLIILVTFNGVFFPYVATKVLLWGVLLLISSCGLLGSLFWQPQRREMVERTSALMRKPIFILATLALISMVVSALIAFEPEVAWQGSFVRWNGVVTYIFLYVYFIYLAIFFREKEWKYFSIVSSLSFGIVFLGTIGQALTQSGRPDVFLGNPIFLAHYFLLCFFFLTLALVNRKSKNYWHIGIPLVLAFLGVVATESRGVLVGIFIGALVTLFVEFLRTKKDVYSTIFGKKFTTKKTIGVILLLFIIGCGIYIPTRHAAIWQHLPITQRLSQISINDSTTRSRILSIQTSFSAINPKNEGWERTFFGWGNENYQFAWQKYYNPEIYHYDKAAFDRAHNAFLDVLVMQGVVGLILYLVYWGYVLVMVWKLQNPERSLLFATIIAYLIQNLFVFESITGSFYLIALVAYILYRINYEK